MLILSLSASLASVWWHYVVPMCLVGIALAVSKLPVSALLRDMRFFSVIILIVLISNAFLIEGDPIPGFWIESVSMQGVMTGLRFAGRLTVIIMVCTIVTGTTSLLVFKNVIEWYLRPVPFIPEVKVATMINLTFVLIPVILDSYTEMMSAQKARGIELRKNPIRRVSYIVFPLLSRTLRRTDEIVHAMEARCYSEERTRAMFKTNKADWLILSICVAVLGLVIL